jgi:ribonuclease BN (tRNA processing enzyme)
VPRACATIARMTFRFVPLGVGDAFTARYYSTCLALLTGASDDVFLVDCPHPIQKMMREASLACGESIDPARVRGVVLTHLHADHSSGLEGLAYWMRFHRQRKLELVVHPDVLARLWEGHLAAGMEQLMPTVGAPVVRMRLEDYFDVIPLSEDASTTVSAFTFEARRTIHHVPTFALRVRAEGRTLGHSADTAFDPTLIEWLAASDLVVHETNHGTHTPYEKLAALPAELRAKMRLVHYPDEFDVEASVIEPLRQGVAYAV